MDIDIQLFYIQRFNSLIHIGLHQPVTQGCGGIQGVEKLTSIRL